MISGWPSSCAFCDGLRVENEQAVARDSAVSEYLGRAERESLRN